MNNGFEFEMGAELSEAELALVQGGSFFKKLWKVVKSVGEGVILIGGAIVAGGKALNALGVTGNSQPAPPPPVVSPDPNDPIFI